MPSTYKYNPHKHVKIWLSKDKTSFLNLENQKRLIEMREKNPTDEINFVYDSSLLNEFSKTQLKEYCTENQINSVDIAQFDVNKMTVQEKKLHEYYKDEITHLDEGGNLAVASDILRWISNVYNLGTYSDFDFPIDTTNLPDVVEVKSPLLLNIGSLGVENIELIVSNNDFIAVVDKNKGQKKIAQIQKQIIHSLTNYQSAFIEETTRDLKTKHTFLSEQFLGYMHNRAEVEYIKKANYLNQNKISSRELRKHIKEITTNQTLYLKMHKDTPEQSDQDIIKKLRNLQKEQLTFMKWLFFHKEYLEIQALLQCNDNDFLKKLMQKEQSLYIKSIVVCTTGPVSICKGLFDKYVFSSKKCDEIVSPVSFHTYKLNNAFCSKNSIALHENILGTLKFLGADIGALSDSSWLEEGKEKQNDRQNTIQRQANTLKQQLPIFFQAAQKNILANIEKTKIEQKSFFATFNQKSREKHLQDLRQLQTCFKDNKFHINTYKTLALDMHLRNPGILDKILAFFFPDTIIEIIRKIDAACYDARRFQVDDHGSIALHVT